MITKHKFLDYLIWCFMRVFVYFFLYAFILYSYNDPPKYALEFKKDLKLAAKLSNIEIPKIIQDNLIHPMPLFVLFLKICLFCTIMATLGFKIFQFISGLIVVFIDLVKYHPLREPEVKKGEPYDALNQVYPWIDTILIGMFAVVIFFNTFVNFKEEWIFDTQSNQTTVVLEEDVEEYEKDKKNKDKKVKKD